MISHIRGALVSVSPSTVVIDVNGIGYVVFISCRVLSELSPIGEKVQLHTSFVVREASQALYGFLSPHERDLFELLMNVSGVGPKLSLSLIGHLTIAELQMAVACQDLPTLCRVPGVGKKTAERLVVELKDKLPDLIPEGIGHVTSPSISAPSASARDAMQALINLGYNQGVAQKAIRKTLTELPEDAELSLLITTALKNV